jgi:hypothetical protein
VLANLRVVIKSLGELRDGCLLAAGIVYLFGYVGWSMYAWRLGLGVAPAIDAQYFVAGAPIAVVTAGAIYLLVVAGRFISATWRYRDGPVPTVVRHVAFLLLAATATVCIIAKEAIWIIRGFSWHTFAVSVSFGVPAALIYAGHRRLVEFVGGSAVLWRFVTVITVLSVSLAVVYGFVFVLYPAFPGVLGGGRPKRAYLDLHPERLSPNTAQLLGLPVVAATTPSGVVRSREVQLLETREQLIIFLDIPRPGKVTPRFELPRSVAEAIVWQE